MSAAIQSFLTGICQRCPVSCWDRPDAKVKRHFHSPIHPAMG